MACNESADEKPERSSSDIKPETLSPTPMEAGLKTIVFYGNSLTAGYGVNPEESFVGIISNRIDSLGLPYKVINAGVSGETTAGGVSRIDWILKQPIDIFILELGGNDGLRGINPESSYNNLQSIIDQTESKYPEVEIIIAGMMAPPNMGSEFTTKFRNIFPTLAEENDAILIPFLLEDVGGIPSLNLADGIHPNPEGHKIVADNIWRILKDLL